MTISALDTQASAALFHAGERLPDGLVVFLASYLIWAFGALMLVLLWKKRARARSLLPLIAGSALAYAINAALHLAVFRARPFVALEVSAIINTAHLASSFPSDHAAVAFSLAVGYVFLDKKNAWLFLAFAFMVSLGRVLAGVHFAGDVLAGAAVGVLAGVLVHHRPWRSWFAATWLSRL
ncbi:MAG: phosphatase PAP2 family protein [Parcubacteria group bacterium]|nr:phosphatase PAP2 family protein [Parcubacteria group bacterium]